MMIKQVFAILAVFLLFVFPSASLKNLTYQETDKVALNVSASDPDKDAFSIRYGSPLDGNGQWQTAYGDAGVYRLNITVSDGDLSDSEEVRLIINRKEEPPMVTSLKPSTDALSVTEGRMLSFSIAATDLNKDVLGYVWSLDGRNVSGGKGFSYALGYDEEGEHALEVHVTDGFLTTIRKWTVEVADVDLDALVMGRLEDVSAREGDLVRLALPDFRYYGLKYAISAPLERNLWQTGYNSSGAYRVDVHVSGKGFDEEKTVRIRVQNVDRPPVMGLVPPQVAVEDHEMSFALRAVDPDGDKISYSIRKKPNGAAFEKGVFTWTPGFGEVRNTGIVADISRKLLVLSRVIDIEVSAQSSNLTTAMIIPITVFNANRPPALGHILPLMLDEGDVFSFSANATDPDNDPLSWSYDGPFRRGEQIGYEAAGSYAMKVAVSDGFLEDSRYVPITIRNVNRAPEMGLPPVAARENQTTTYNILASDPDNDALSFAISGAPQGMVLSDGIIEWTPPFSTKQEEHAILVRASDGKAAVNGTLSITVSHENRPPVIAGPSAEYLSAERNVPVLLSINATDPDGDSISYEWRFGRESYPGSMHQRTFSTKGQKTVTAMAGDGRASAQKTFIITVS